MHFVYFKAAAGDRLGNPESTKTAAEIGGNTYDGGARPQGNIKFTGYRMFQCLHARTRTCVHACVSLSSATSREGPKRDLAGFFSRSKRKAPLSPSFPFSFLSLFRGSSFPAFMRVCERACVTASAVFGIFYFAWKMVSRSNTNDVSARVP